jgi:hypothetical protein
MCDNQRDFFLSRAWPGLIIGFEPLNSSFTVFASNPCDLIVNSKDAMPQENYGNAEHPTLDERPMPS